MRKLLLMVVSVLALNACTAANVISITTVITDVKQVCGILVPAADIAALISSDPNTITEAALVKQICDAFNASKNNTAAAQGGVIVINGVPIHYSTT